ncbi:MAG: phosphoadenosine phosphosulfate reductase family protein [Candidatus Brockarchaeota archaeon]|nr:phosphoadenosine phosphosulfate reductase family protein [Candidatus Brockarchaeota archaeon]
MQMILPWCRECNVPLLGEKCNKCGSEAKKILLPPYTDPRPAFQGDFEIIREAMVNCYGEDVTDSIVLKDHPTILTSLHFLDQAYEIIQDGVSIGRVFFDFYTLSWRFKPLAEGCVRLWEKEGIGLRIGNNGLSEGMFLSESSFQTPGVFLPLIDSNGNVAGLGESTAKGLLVERVWKKVEKTEGYRASLKDVLNANEYYLTREGSRACRFIIHIQQRFRRPVVVSYSGGKDSLILLLLTLKSGIEPLLFFNNTGLEMPETIRNVDEVALKLGLKLMIADAGNSFWDYFESFGPPARDYRWCCKVCKLIPTSRAFLSQGEVLSLVGQRKRESLERARSRNVWVNYWIKSALVASPINDWSMLQVWLYLMLNNKIDLVNPLYFKGLDRIGCFMCPACRIAEFKIVEKLHPDLWRNWEDRLYKWASEKNLRREWASYHLWRWLKLPSKMLRFIEELGLEGYNENALNRTLLKTVSINREKTRVTVFFNVAIPIATLANMASSLGETILKGDSLTVSGDVFKACISENMIVIDFVEEKSIKLILNKISGLVAKALLCKGCGSCVDNCPVGAVKLVSKIPIVDGQLCLRCEYGACLAKCPVFSFFVKEDGFKTLCDAQLK